MKISYIYLHMRILDFYFFISDNNYVEFFILNVLYFLFTDLISTFKITINNSLNKIREV